MTLDKNEIHEMLKDIRRAHRLIYQYQDRILNVIKEVRDQYDFNNYPVGKKHFSNPLHNTEKFYGNKQKKVNTEYEKNKEAKLNINGKWAWDFIYSYEIEYYFGMKSIVNENKHCLFSIFQISDNGYYLKDGSINKGSTKHISKTNVSEFWDVEESNSYFIFVAECFDGNSTPFAFPNVISKIYSLYGGNKDYKIETLKNGSKIYAKRYSMEDFFDKDSTQKCIEDFAESLFINTNFNIK